MKIWSESSTLIDGTKAMSIMCERNEKVRNYSFQYENDEELKSMIMISIENLLEDFIPRVLPLMSEEA